MKRRVLTHKQGMDMLQRVQKEVDSGKMLIKAACKKHKFPLWKYSYWRKIKDESDSLDQTVDAYLNDSLDPKSPNYEPIDRNFEAVHDSSAPAIRARLTRIKDLQRAINLEQSTNVKLKAELFNAEEQLEQVKKENLKLRDALLKRVLGD